MDLKTLPGYKRPVTWKGNGNNEGTTVSDTNNVFTASALPKGKPEAPTVDEITEGDKDIKVKTPDDGDTIIIEIPDPTPQDPHKKKEIKVEKDPGTNKWKLGPTPVPEERGKLIIPVDPTDITTGKDIEVRVKDKTTDKVSDPTIKMVRPKIGPTILTLDENYSGGRIRDYYVFKGEPIDSYLYTPHRRGYTFKGWSYDSRYLEEVRPGDRVYYPTTIYAIWSKQKAKDEKEPEIVDNLSLIHI